MARTARKGRRARQVLDQRLDQLRPIVVASHRPAGGWVRAIREALGMSLADLAARMDVATSTAARVEASEREGRIQVQTLLRAANALECDLVLALIPRRPLEQMVSERARELAVLELVGVEHTMTLEDQGLTSQAVEQLVQEVAAEMLDRPGLWRTV